MTLPARIICLAATGFLLAGCASKLPVQPMSFLLDPGQMPSTWAGRSKLTATVMFVDVTAPYGNAKFTYRLSRDKWEFDPYNGFLVSPAEMFTGIIRRAVADSRIFSGFRLPGDAGLAEVLIECRISELYGDFRDPGRPQAVMGMEFQVFRREDGKRVQVLASSYSQRVDLGERRPAVLVDAWNEALRLNLASALRDIATAGYGTPTVEVTAPPL